MLGKQKCKMLKEIRQRIADENDIPYVTRECSFQGECSGTCPKCESELRYLERQLALRQSLGKRVAVAGLCASMAMAVSACGPLGIREVHTTGAVEAVSDPAPDVETEMGEVAIDEGGEEPDFPSVAGTPTPAPPEDPEDEELLGEPLPEEYELMGDVDYDPLDGENNG